MHLAHDLAGVGALPCFAPGLMRPPAYCLLWRAGLVAWHPCHLWGMRAEAFTQNPASI